MAEDASAGVAHPNIVDPGVMTIFEVISQNVKKSFKNLLDPDPDHLQNKKGSNLDQDTPLVEISCKTVRGLVAAFLGSSKGGVKSSGTQIMCSMKFCTGKLKSKSRQGNAGK